MNANSKSLTHLLSPSKQSNIYQSLTVGEINTLVADVLIANLPNALSVEGEISNLSVAGSGHRYFSLKDSNSIISCALFRSATNRISRDTLNQLSNGDKVIVKASLSVYQPRGSYQLIVSDIEPAGFGALAKAFATLKQKLDESGLTSAERKRPIPEWAQSIAVVTSGTGAAVQDVLTTLARRAPFIPVTVFPTLVQGKNAPDNIIRSLEYANNNENASIILLVRGGGSIEDLQAFNDERVAIAVVNSRLPIVSGVGHETDFTIVDFVSDARAPTPTAAAEWVSPDKAALKQALLKQQQRLQSLLERRWQEKKQDCQSLNQRLIVQHPVRALHQQGQRLDELTSRLSRHTFHRISSQTNHLAQLRRQLFAYSPQQQLNRSARRLSDLQIDLQHAIDSRISQERLYLQLKLEDLGRVSIKVKTNQQQLKGLDARLTLLSPLGVLGRGYALVFDASGQLLRNANDVASGERVLVQLANGSLSAKVLPS